MKIDFLLFHLHKKIQLQMLMKRPRRRKTDRSKKQKVSLVSMKRKKNKPDSKHYELNNAKAHEIHYSTHNSFRYIKKSTVCAFDVNSLSTVSVAHKHIRTLTIWIPIAIQRHEIHKKKPHKYQIYWHYKTI